MIPLSIEGLRESLRSVLSPSSELASGLRQDNFSAHYENKPGWAIGPFARDDSLTFTGSGQWRDPTHVGWIATAAFNPSLIVHDEDLLLFYRASPQLESTASRIGLASFTRADGWRDSPANPIIYPTLDNELLGCEDPKIYRADGRYFLFYNGVFPVDPIDAARYPAPDYPAGEVGCDINLAVSDDLKTWAKLGNVVPHSISRLWAKGAVIPRRPNGDAAKIDGRYLMYLSEGCNGTFQVGSSTDLIHWEFREQPYLDMTPLGGHLHEVACAIVPGEGSDDLVIDFYYTDDAGRPAGAQALFSTREPFCQLALNSGGTLAWGGLIQYEGDWLFPQGWDAPAGQREISFYRSPIRHDEYNA